MIRSLRIDDLLQVAVMGTFMRYCYSEFVSSLDGFRPRREGITSFDCNAWELIIHQVFARKIVRIIGQVRKEDINNEARLISSFIENGGHNNIVTIMAHGWITSFNYYFIDMELCELSLHDYIGYFADWTPLGFEIVPAMSPVFVEKTCSPVLRIQNIWTIGTHIVRGLEFMHANVQVHRDLKPQNGTMGYIRQLTV